MKFSILIAVLILGIASFLGYERHQKIQTLTVELQDLVKQGEEFEIPTDPSVQFSPKRSAQRAHKRAREAMVNDFIGELMALIKESQKPGMQNDPEFQKKGMKLISTMLDLSPAELKLMVQKVSADDSLNQQERQQLTMFAIMMLSNDNPDTALALILEAKESKLVGNQMDRHMLTMALGSLAKNDPIAAAEWLKDNGKKVGGVTNDLTRAIIVQASQQDIGIALGLIKDLDEEAQASAYASLGTGVDAERADEFLNALRGHEAKDSDIAGAFQSLAGGPFVKDPDAAIAWLEKTELSSTEKNSFMQGLQYYQIKDHPETWMNWIVEQNDGANETNPNQTTKNIIRMWAREDFVAAGEWVGKLPEGNNRNEAVSSYAEALSKHEPGAAEEWAVTLPEGDQRTQALDKIHKTWLTKDPEIAAEFAGKYGLTVPEGE